jgi:hypothetical protein
MTPATDRAGVITAEAVAVTTAAVVEVVAVVPVPAAS